MYYYDERLLPLGVMLQSVIVTAGVISHINPLFMMEYMFVVMSFAGVIGTHYNTMIVNEDKRWDVFWGGVIIWGLAYTGYVNMPGIPEWDAFLNNLQLYRLWYIAFFFTIRVYYYLLTIR